VCAPKTVSTPAWKQHRSCGKSLEQPTHQPPTTSRYFMLLYYSAPARQPVQPLNIRPHTCARSLLHAQACATFTCAAFTRAAFTPPNTPPYNLLPCLLPGLLPCRHQSYPPALDCCTKWALVCFPLPRSRTKQAPCFVNTHVRLPGQSGNLNARARSATDLQPRSASGALGLGSLRNSKVAKTTRVQYSIQTNTLFKQCENGTATKRNHASKTSIS
jgi:hypothetical protein